MDEQQEQQQQDEASVCLDYGEEDVISMEKEDSKFDLKSAGFQLAHLNPLSPPLLTRTNMNTICVCLVGLCFRMQTLKGGKFDATLLAVGEVPIAFLDALVPHSEASTEAGERDTSKIRVTGHPPLRVEVSLLPVSIAEARVFVVLRFLEALFGSWVFITSIACFLSCDSWPRALAAGQV